MTKKGVWDLQDVRDEYLAGNWSYSDPSAAPGPFLLYVTGSASGGRLGLNDQVQRSSPTQIPGTTWDQPINGDYSMPNGCFKTDGTLWLWGDNGQGQLAQNDTVKRSSPTQVPGTTWDNNYYATTRFRLLGS